MFLWLCACVQENGRSQLQRAQQDVDEVCDIMLKNVNKASEREGKLGDLENRADQLLEQVNEQLSELSRVVDLSCFPESSPDILNCFIIFYS